MKKLINDPARVVREMLEGFVAGAPGQALLADENVVVRSDLPEPDARRVAVISGGGSGHEPAHAGYVGQGMLTAAVAGDVFTSPSSDAVLAAIRQVAGPAGVLLIVKNYTGDRLNFGLAAELARGQGIAVEMVIVADDVALRDTVSEDRRRGIAGTLLVHKIAGAAAEAGNTLAEVAAAARHAATAVGSMGVALGSCTLPAVGRPGFELGADDIEVGLGIHGEPGVCRESISAMDELARRVLEVIVEDRGLSAGQSLALLVNGLGSTPPMELAIAQRAALNDLRDRGLEVVRVWSGTLLSALDMPGFSYSLLPVDDQTLAWLDASCAAPAWPGAGRVNRDPLIAERAGVGDDFADQEVADQGVAEHGADQGSPNTTGTALHAALCHAADALIKAEPELTDLDSRAGDGDLGHSMQRGAEAVKALDKRVFVSAEAGLAAAANALRKAIGGSSGPFYATALLRASRTLAASQVQNHGSEPRPSDWSRALDQAVEAISELGGARPGDRTMIDALQPAADAFKQRIENGASPSEAWSAAVKAAENGREATSTMHAGAGRASYLGERALGVVDGGAAAVVIWMQAIEDCIRHG